MIKIGSNVLIAPNCIITDYDFHNIEVDKRDGLESVFSKVKSILKTEPTLYNLVDIN